MDKNKMTMYSVMLLSKHIETTHNDVGEFAALHQLTPQQVLAMTASNNIWINGRIYHRATQNNPDFSITGATRAMDLTDYIDEYHEGSTISFAEAFGESVGFVERECIKGALFCKEEILSPYPDKSPGFAIPLRHHIANRHHNNQTTFAKHHDSTQQQVNRWVNKECVWYKGDVYMKRTNINPNPLPLPDRMDVTSIVSHIESEFGNDRLAFCKHYDIRPQQLERYINYDSIWVHGDIYKNQSKFSYGEK